MIILICGGRDFRAVTWFNGCMDRAHAEHKFTHVIHGAARGADYLAHRWACSRRVQPVSCEANWEEFDLAAGAIRNKAMLALKPAMVFAFPGGSGTDHMVELAKRAGIPVRSFDPTDDEL